jgi:hypothetical protein
MANVAFSMPQQQLINIKSILNKRNSTSLMNIPHFDLFYSHIHFDFNSIHLKQTSLLTVFVVSKLRVLSVQHSQLPAVSCVPFQKKIITKSYLSLKCVNFNTATFPHITEKGVS